MVSWMLCWLYGTKNLSRKIEPVDVQVLPIIFRLADQDFLSFLLQCFVRTNSQQSRKFKVSAPITTNHAGLNKRLSSAER